MPVPFGFSVGDFLAVIELTWKVTQALRDSEGAVHDILETLMSFQRAISTCQTLALEWMRLSDADASLPERSLVNGINYQLKFCRERLLKLSTKLEPYTRALMKQKGTRTTWDHLHKVKWIFSREEADSLQKDLSIHVQGLERYIAELGIHILQRTIEQSRSSLTKAMASIEQSQSSMTKAVAGIELEQSSITKAVASMERRVTEVHRNISSLHIELPKILGYAWEGGFSAHDKPIILMDALGRNVPIPFLFCTMPNDFHDLVELMFRNLPGHERVKRKSYNLIKQHSTEVIVASGWSGAVSPGSVVVMSIEVTIAVTEWEIRVKSSKTISCPRCHGELNGSSARCSRCYHDCTILDKDRIVKLAPQPVRPPLQPRPSTRATPTKRTSSRLELAHFQRVHLVRERMKPAWDYQSLLNSRATRGTPRPSALHMAIASGSLSEVRWLLDNEVELETRDDLLDRVGWTPLQRAVQQGDYNIVDCILGAGAEVNAPAAKYDGRTALQSAAESGHLDIIERLLEAGAEVNAPAAEYNGRTALQSAAESGHLDIIERLREAGAEVNAPAAEDYGRTALQAAARSGNVAIVDRLLEVGAEADAPAAEFDGRTALRSAAESGHLDIIERLLEAGAEVNAPAAEDYGRTALQAAARSGNVAIVERLLEAGADVNAPAAEYDGRTALQSAAESDHLEILERLLEAGAEVNAPPGKYQGRTALQSAADSGHLEIIERLLEAGAEVNAPVAEDYGRTALQAAAMSGNVAIVDRLLEANADVNAPAAQQNGRTALQAAATLGNLAIVERLFEAGAEVNAPAGYGGKTALGAAASFGHLEIVERLLEAGAEVNASNKEGETALQAAEAFHLVKTVDILRRAGAKC